MNGLFAGFMGLFASFGSFFHGGDLPKHPMMNNIVASTTVTPSRTITPGVRRGDRDGMMNGQRPFFGTVTAVSGSTITLQMQRPMMLFRQANPSVTPTITPPALKTFTITVDSSTTYTGGTLADITTGTKIAGIGKTTGDSAITAVKITINPTVPTGFPGRGMGRQGMRGFDDQNEGRQGGNEPQ